VLIAQTAITALQLPKLDQVHYTAPGFLFIALVLSMLAVFFTCLQQRTYGFVEDIPRMRAWLSNGAWYENTEGELKLRSSILSHQFLQAPFELLSIAITLYLVGVGVYLGSALHNGVALSTGGVAEGNRGRLIAFIISTSFVLSLFGQLLGGKDIEILRSRKDPKVVELASIRRPKAAAGNAPANEGEEEQIREGSEPVGQSSISAYETAALAAHALRKAGESNKKAAEALDAFAARVR